MNIQARLRLTFGQNFGLNIESEQGEGTKVKIIHPVIYAHEEKGRGSNRDGSNI
jgi:LytS/YehU family sensor histidine kinase